MSEVEPVRWLDLSVQIVTLILLAYGYWVFKWKRKLRLHTYAFVAATILNAAGVLAIMLPLFLDESNAGELSIRDGHGFILWEHHILGIVATFLSLFIVIRWALRHGNAKKCRGWALMNVTMLVWMATLLIGFWLFAVDIFG
jgi:uncharacterized membrane protein YozB (DUF420 family)